MEPRHAAAPERGAIMRKRIQRIVLSRETLRHLQAMELPQGDLARAQGAGILPNSDFNTCRCPTASCKPGFC
jgi:hypothetical protein